MRILIACVLAALPLAASAQAQSLTPDEARAALAYLSGTPLKGADCPAFLGLAQKLNAIVTPPPPPAPPAPPAIEKKP